VLVAVILMATTADIHAQSESSQPAVLQGAVKQHLVLDDALLKSLPAVTIDVTFETGQGKKSGRYTGVLLWTLLEKAEPIDEPGKNTNLRHTLLITGETVMPWRLLSARSIRTTKESRS
jgi:hypothetical protein